MTEEMFKNGSKKKELNKTNLVSVPYTYHCTLWTIKQPGPCLQ